MIAEVALAVILLASAGLQVRTLRHALAVDTGFDPAGVSTMSIALAGPRYDSTGSTRSFYRNLVAQVEASPGVEAIRLLTLPGDPLPECDAVVSVGHVLSYLPDEASLETALVNAAKSLRPGGVLALDLLDLQYGDDLAPDEIRGRVGDDWAVIVRLSRPAEKLFLRENHDVRPERGRLLAPRRRAARPA